MSVEPGQTLAHYRLIEKIGEGGMGVVWKASDERLGRTVALKTLRADLLASDHARRRFIREARAAAAINHPNIATVYEIDEVRGVTFIAMEYVEGKSLRAALTCGRLSTPDALRIATQIAEGLACAHRARIVHRDLKPENILVGPERWVKILDFGLAKLLQQPEGDGGVAQRDWTKTLTREGHIVGTVSYMSPEQASGAPVDTRSDVFSFGTVLYEMITGRRLFTGPSQVDILHAIIHQPVAPAIRLEPELPAALEPILVRCLAKDRGDRYQDTRDLVRDLMTLVRQTESASKPPHHPVSGPRPRTRAFVYTSVGILALLSAILGYLLVMEWRRQRGGQGPLARTVTRLTSLPGREHFPSFSPDGDTFAYQAIAGGDWDIFVQRVGGQRAFNLTEDCPEDDIQPAFSADGGSIAFRSERNGGGVFVMGATGESVRRITDFGYDPSWSPDGKQIAVATLTTSSPAALGTRESRLWIADVLTGETTRVTESDAFRPHWSHGGFRIAFWGRDKVTHERDIWTIPVEGGPVTRVTDDPAVDWNPVWAPTDDHLYFSSDRGGSSNLWRVPIDETSGGVRGPPQPVTSGGSASRGQLTVARDAGRIAYVESVDTSDIHKIEFDPVAERVAGEPIPLTRGLAGWGGPRLSPDGEWIALRSAMVPQMDVYVMRSDGTELRQLTNDSARDWTTSWSLDSRRISFYSNRGGSFDVWTIDRDGSGLQQITKSDSDVFGGVWTPDGARFFYWEQPRNDTLIIDPARPWEEQAPRALPAINDAGDKLTAWSCSPDGVWLAGQLLRADNTGGGIYLYSLESREYRELLDFGDRPQWLSDGQRIVFYSNRRLFLVNVESRNPRAILSLEPSGRIGSWFDLSPDDRWIYFVLSTTESDVWMLAPD